MSAPTFVPGRKPWLKASSLSLVSAARVTPRGSGEGNTRPIAPDVGAGVTYLSSVINSLPKAAAFFPTDDRVTSHGDNR